MGRDVRRARNVRGFSCGPFGFPFLLLLFVFLRPFVRFQVPSVKGAPVEALLERR